MATATRTLRAPRGTSLTCKGWPQETARRLPTNNLDPDVAERSDDLIVYRRSGRALRNRPAGQGLMGDAQPLAAAMTDPAALVIGVAPGVGPSAVVTPPAGYPEAVATAEREDLQGPTREERAC